MLLILEYDKRKKTDHSDNLLFITTIPSHRVRELPDPDGHSKWLMHRSTKQKILNAPGYLQPVSKPPGNIKLHIIRLTPMIRQGIFAKHDIPMGEIIFAEQPLLVSPHSLVPVMNMYVFGCLQYSGLYKDPHV